MTTKHPERRPVHEVEGVIDVSNLEGQRLHVTVTDENTMRRIVAVLAKTAERIRQDKSNETKAA